MKAWNVSRLLSGVPVLAMAVTILAVTRASATNSLDYDLPNQAGHFYTQTNGRGGQGGTGYAITNADGIPFWDVYRGLGGLDALGYPVSRRFTWDRFTVQAMQKVVFQWHPDSHQVAFVNVLDRMHELGKDGWLQVYRQTPPPFDTAPDAGLAWTAVTQRHWAVLDQNAAIKARGSPRNDISSAEAYGWYRDFTRDVVDTIRTYDRQHLIFMGAQYIAELVDWEYRPNSQVAPDRVPTYRTLVQQMLDACGSSCWNVWRLTDYDFNPYPVDDALAFGQSGVAVVATEYGFTRGTPDQEQARYGGDRVAAMASGLNRTWQDISGQTHPQVWGAPQLFASARVAGIAPWGSPAPGPNAGLDTDGNRGIAGAPDEAGLWSTWGNLGASVNDANRAAGPSAACLTFRSS